jgi:hypothetical protein
MAATIYLRHSQVANQSKDVPQKILTMNNISAFLGYLAAIGLSMVGNFQQAMDGRKKQTAVHNLGALLCFDLGVFYGFFQSYITRALSTNFWSWLMAIVRFILSALTAIFFITYIVFVRKAYAQFNGTFADHMHWGPEDGGYEEHIISAIVEYLMALTFTLFLITYYDELKTIKRVRDLWYPKQQ